MNPRSPRLLRACSILLLLAPSACQSGSGTTRNESLRDTGRELFKPSKSSTGSGAAGTDWTIMVAAFTGADQARSAKATQSVVQSLGFNEVATEVRGKATIVALGKYPEPGDPRAQEDLAKIREFIVDGQRPYARAMLVPPEQNTGGAISELDLRSAREKYGPRAVFTLQVGVYARQDGKPPSEADLAQFRQAAEQAAARLRRDGDEAYYYHGPFRSMVTVGIYDYSDSDRGSGKPESQRLTEARARHPYNLLNGAPYRAKRAGPASATPARDDYVKSDLVEIPQS